MASHNTSSPHDLELLSAYLDGELGDRERAALENRLTQDAALRRALDDLRATVALLRELPRLKAPRNFTLDPAVYGRVAPWWRRWFTLELTLQFAGAVGAAASVALIVLALAWGAGNVNEKNAKDEVAYAPEGAAASLSDAETATFEWTANTPIAYTGDSLQTTLQAQSSYYATLEVVEATGTLAALRMTVTASAGLMEESEQIGADDGYVPESAPADAGAETLGFAESEAAPSEVQSDADVSGEYAAGLGQGGTGAGDASPLAPAPLAAPEAQAGAMYDDAQSAPVDAAQPPAAAPAVAQSAVAQDAIVEDGADEAAFEGAAAPTSEYLREADDNENEPANAAEAPANDVQANAPEYTATPAAADKTPQPALASTATPQTVAQEARRVKRAASDSSRNAGALLALGIVLFAASAATFVFGRRKASRT